MGQWLEKKDFISHNYNNRCDERFA